MVQFWLCESCEGASRQMLAKDELQRARLAFRFVDNPACLSPTGRRQRKLMAPFFTPRGVQAYAEIMLRDGVRLLERWEGLARSGQTVKIGEEMTQVTAAIILKAMFSTETDAAIVEMKDAVGTMIDFTAASQAGVRLPVWLPTPANRKYRAAREKVLRYIHALIAGHETTARTMTATLKPRRTWSGR